MPGQAAQIRPVPHPGRPLGAEYPYFPSCKEQAAGCRYPRVPRQCGGQNTVLQPVPPSPLGPHKPSTVLPSKVGMKKEGIQRGATVAGSVMLSIWDGGIRASVSPGELGVEGCLGMLNTAPCFSQPPLSFPAGWWQCDRAPG